MREWARPFFFVNVGGSVALRAAPASRRSIDLLAVVERLRRKNIACPVLLRFQDILRARVERLHQAFGAAIEKEHFRNSYRALYPIKVNQLHEVVEELLDAGRESGLGLECGSKSELVATLPLMVDDTLLVCNGYKDDAMIDLILSFQRFGREVVPIVEKMPEFRRLIARAEKLKIVPKLGVRVRLSASGSGRWAETGGDRSKFGITFSELLELLGEIQERGWTETLALLHFHLGSQIQDVKAVRHAVREIAQVYAECHRLGVPVRMIDVGGGLAVNYGAGYGTQKEGINYSLEEYANVVVATVREVCDEKGAPHPLLLSESGRALTAHHSVLIVEVLGAEKKNADGDFPPPLADDHETVTLLRVIHEKLESAPTPREAPRISDLLEGFHRMVEARDRADSLFRLGYISLEQRARAQRIFWAAAQRIRDHLQWLQPERVPVELRDLEDRLSDNYLCDFSVFQSMLDYWSIGQKFPVMPIHRLTRRPERRGILLDLTCDSDGKVGKFISREGVKNFLELHDVVPGEPYYIGVFLMGAYQDIMGDMHNLLGRVTEAHVYADPKEPGGFYIEKIIPGQTVEEVLAQVQYFPRDLRRRLEEQIRGKIRSGALRPRAGMELIDKYQAFFDRYTYLDSEAPKRRNRR